MKVLLASLLLVVSFVSVAQTLAPLLSATAEQVYQPNPDESLVYVTGIVRQRAEASTDNPQLMPSNLSLLGATNEQNLAGLQAAPNVEVRFWHPDQPHITIRTQTDAQGQYVVGLDSGEWVGEACGSEQGYYPNAWQLNVANQQLVSMRSIATKTIRLDALSPSNLFAQGSTVTLSGKGFGCNGVLWITYSNAVSRCGTAQEVEYDHAEIRVSEFIQRSDTQLQFVMPALSDNRNVAKHIASIRYQRGDYKSAAVTIGEQVQDFLAPDNPLCLAEQPVANTPQVDIITDAQGQALVAGNVTNNVDAQQSSSQTSTQSSSPKVSFAVQPSEVASESTKVKNTGFKGGFIPFKEGARR